MNPMILMVGSTLLVASTWQTLVGAIPYGIQYGLISLVFCLASILTWELIMGKPGGSIRMSINKYVLAFIFGTSGTWICSKMLHFSVEACYCLAGSIGLTIDVFAPWVKKEIFDRLKKVFKS